ncbi:MAG TPA: hypothetical protein GX497_03560 [Bacillus bacterium]|nr:hypothetical protein [Bacillus sp. (in: firmicutes)]
MMRMRVLKLGIDVAGMIPVAGGWQPWLKIEMERRGLKPTRKYSFCWKS